MFWQEYTYMPGDPFALLLVASLHDAKGTRGHYYQMLNLDSLGEFGYVAA
jgi:hypothetical protein